MGSLFFAAADICFELLRLLQAVSVGEKEEVSQPEAELTNCLSEFYQRKSGEASVPSGPRDYKKRRTYVMGYVGTELPHALPVSIYSSQPELCFYTEPKDCPLLSKQF